MLFLRLPACAFRFVRQRPDITVMVDYQLQASARAIWYVFLCPYHLVCFSMSVPFGMLFYVRTIKVCLSMSVPFGMLFYLLFNDRKYFAFHSPTHPSPPPPPPSAAFRTDAKGTKVHQKFRARLKADRNP